MRNCKNSRNNITCDISNATRVPGLSLVCKPEHLQPIIAGIVFDKMLKKIKGGRYIGLAHYLDHSPPLAMKVINNIRDETVNTLYQSATEVNDKLKKGLNLQVKSGHWQSMMNWPTANLEALPNKIHVSNRTKTNLLNYSRPSVTWLYQGLSSNKLAHMLNGNRGRSYNIGMWNCRKGCLLYTSPSPRDRTRSRMPSSA